MFEGGWKTDMLDEEEKKNFFGWGGEFIHVGIA